jgi:7,8-dihydropterin-6-yl-methyl-4-(beta-D-ribofuranosyl)aminobenzene 5'-phosphate synthase
MQMFLTSRFNREKRRAEQRWQQSNVQKIENLGAAKYLEILPLIDWYTSGKDLIGEAGVSYLIRTDESSIMFDVGLNHKQSDPSPLLRNLKRLQLNTDDFHTIVISHNHADHVGGRKWARCKSFSLTADQMDLGRKAVYTSIPMTYPGLSPIFAPDPTLIARGIATIGTIQNQDFFLGQIVEQALAVSVKGKGIVLIIGCGHQTLPKILDRAAALFDEPVYGVVGGLHYPVTDSRLKMMGIKLQRYVGTGKVPWRPITLDEVQINIALLKKLNPKVVAISPHDTCDVTLAAFRDAFPDAYEEVRVGKKISIGTVKPAL